MNKVEGIMMRLDIATKRHLNSSLKEYYGIATSNDEIEEVDTMLQGKYAALHETHILNEIVSRNIDKILLKHRTKENVSDLERLFLQKLIFRYRTYASMCYRAGIPIATILLCRTAVEAGLREKIAEEKAKDIPGKVWEQMKRLTKKLKLWQLIQEAEREGIITGDEIEKLFTIDERMKSIIPNPRTLLDKYIHADLPAIIAFLKEIGVDTRVRGIEDVAEERKVQAEMLINDIAVFTLKATARLAERLYLV